MTSYHIPIWKRDSKGQMIWLFLRDLNHDMKSLDLFTFWDLEWWIRIWMILETLGSYPMRSNLDYSDWQKSNLASLSLASCFNEIQYEMRKMTTKLYFNSHQIKIHFIIHFLAQFFKPILRSKICNKRSKLWNSKGAFRQLESQTLFEMKKKNLLEWWISSNHKSDWMQKSSIQSLTFYKGLKSRKMS